MKRFGAATLMLLIALFTPTAFAQNATTSLRGIVKDPSGALVPGATIKLDAKAIGLHLTAASKSDGVYQFLQIPPAKYTITISAPGFGEQTKAAELLVNQPATINFALTIKSSDTVVDVTSGAETLNTTDASLGGTANNAMIQALPSETRNVPDLLSLQPGVLYVPAIGTDSRNGAVNGGRSDQGNVTLDGVDDNDQVNGYAFTGVLRETQDSIEEFKVTTGNGNSDEGRSSGAQVSMVTKSGTNSFHGAAYEYYRPTNTVSNDYFNKQGELASGEPNIPPKYLRNIFGADIAGPIVKDKLFFFANYEGERISEDAVVVQTVPCGSSQLGTCFGGTTSTTNPNTYYQGYLQYPSTVNPADVLTPSQVTTLDAYNGCAVCNTKAYPPSPGPDPYALAYFQLLNPANGTTEGDGVNTGSFTFASPNPVAENTTIARIDYIPSEKHRIFARGNLQKDTTLGVINLPGQPPSSKTEDNTKGMTFGYTWTITSNVVNDLRYGYIRQGQGTTGLGGKLDYVDFRATDYSNLATPTAETRNSITSVPVNNIVDNLNVSKGKHNIQIGFNWRLIHQNRISNANSFNFASSNPEWLANDGFTAPDPSEIGLDPVNSSVFGDSYLYAYSNLVGTIGQYYNYYNYQLNSATSASLLGDGANVARHYSANEYEGYVEDAWRIQPNLTMTVGLRYSLLQTPWETKGQEVTPTINTDAWYKTREADALQGEIYEPNLTFAPAGRYWGKPGFYSKAKDNIAPRFALVYAPNNKTSIRAGVGVYFDHYGQALVNAFDQNGGGFGLSTLVSNPAGELDNSSAPRFTGRNAVPSNGAGATVETFPFTPSTNVNTTGFAIAYGIDNKMQTPYTEAYDFSIQRQLPGGFTLETNYVGRMARHLLQAIDLAEPVDYVDPAGGGDYFTAGAQISAFTDQNGANPAAHISAIPYFENVFPYMKNYDYNGESATQAIYSNEWAPLRGTLGATTVLQDIDVSCYYGCPPNHVSRFYGSQFSSLYSLATDGMSYYNSAQITLHHPQSHGLQFDLNYTLAKSIDWGSDTERSGAGGGASAIIDTWHPALNRSVSDFDTKQLVTLNFVEQLPLGKNHALFANAGHVVNGIIGGWQFSGIFRLSSGLPFAVYEPGYTTDYDIGGFGVVTNPSLVKTKRFFMPGGNPQYFAHAAAIDSGGTYGTPIRYPYPGEAGQRNNFRGDGYNDLDLALAKSWSLARYGTLKVTAEAYNVENIVHFDPFSINTGLTEGATFGIASSELTSPRRLQFSIRYEF